MAYFPLTDTETGSLGLPRLFDRGKAASPCTSPTHPMFHSNGFFLPKETVALPTLWFPSKLLLTLQCPTQMPLPLSSLPCTLWVRGQCTSLCVTVMSLSCGWSIVSLSPWWTGGDCIVWPSPEPGMYLEGFGNTLLNGYSPKGRNKHLLSICCGPGPCLPTRGL